jgi:CDP-paratose 2-epimerase
VPHRILITGGAGFVGANLAVALAARHPDVQVVALDNLKRRGSELNLPRLADAGVRFVHGDVRELDDLLALEPVGAIVECSAEPSVLAGLDGSTGYVVRSNLLGAYHCFELARRDGAQVVFLSTSRVYPVAHLLGIGYDEGETRFRIVEPQTLPGVSPAGVAEEFPLDGARTLYGASKLAGELLAAEYADAFGLDIVVNRCGVIAGPWQMGKVDQGVFSFWLASHYFGREIRFIGFGGTGKQVRDLLHIDDLVDLIEQQLAAPQHWSGVTFNVGGGSDCSLSLVETTALCEEITGNTLRIEKCPETRQGDVPIYVSDCRRLGEHSGWRPQRTARDVLEDTFTWIHDNERVLAGVL